MRSDRLSTLAERLAAGQDVDWNAEIGFCADEQERSVVGAMELLARISALHLGGPAHSPEPSSGASLDDAEPQGSIEMEAPAMDHEPIQHWGRLEKLQLIGQGAFGRVYKAWDPVLEIWVALKLAKPEANGDISDMLEEARLLARLRHENIVRIYGAEKHAGRIGIWMELIEGRTIAQIVKSEGPMSEEEAIPIGRTLAQAVAAVHKAGVIHKDIKAHNVMRETGGRIVLMDFGAASRLQAKDAEAPFSLRGTPYYLAPEVLAGGDQSGRSDIYSLGVLLFFLVTGTYPVEADTLEQLREAHRTGRVATLAAERPALSRPFCAVVQRALEHDPERRFQNAGVMAHALERPGPGPRWLKLAPAAAGLAVLVAYLTCDSRRYTVESGLFRLGVTNQQLVSGSSVAPGDRLYLELQASKRLYVYILNQDETGHGALLYPIPGLEQDNPLPANEKLHLPGLLEGKPVYWVVTSAGGRERFILIAARKPQRDLEAVLKDLPPARFNQPIQYPRVDLEEIAIGLREILGLSASDSLQVPQDNDLLRRISELTSQREKQRGVWVRRIDLSNPSR